MQSSNSGVATLDPFPVTLNYINSINYDDILKDYNLPYKSTEFYWQVGNITIKQGWILHISVVRPQFSALLHLLLPIFLSNKVAFKIVRDRQTADYMLEGALGRDYQCKLLVIYPNTASHALCLAKEIIALTAGFKGPSVPTDRLIDGIVYAQFMNLNPQKKKQTTAQNITDWPFEEIQKPNISRPQKLLNFKYYPVSVIKRDSKGDVLKALYFKKLCKVSTCIIKQGRKCMLFDDEGRDIQERLSWQYELHQQLAVYTFVPKAIDLFIQNDDAYLVLEYIQGASFSTLIEGIFRADQWGTPSTQNRISLTNILLEIVKIIQHLHEKGYIHRDITPDNFFIDKKKRIWLLDVELMWSLDSKKYSVPFKTGTPGFMSPEQEQAKTPTIKEDIYAVGALILFALTNLNPLKFAKSITEQLRTTLNFLIGNDRIATIITDCLSTNPLNRPNVELVSTALESYREELLQKESANHQNAKPSHFTQWDTKLKETVQMAIQGLGHASALGPQQCWISNLDTSEDKAKNPQVGAMVYAGWHTGVAGPLWLLALARKNGFDIENCLRPFNESWKFITQRYLNSSHIDASLYTGTAGISLALSLSFDSHLLAPDIMDLQLNKFFETTASGYALSSGIAGQGTALLQAGRWMESAHKRQVLNSYLELLLDNQRPDGSWSIISNENRKQKIELTLANGVPGIVWFLLHYLDTHPDIDVLRSANAACNWLLKNAYQKSSAGYACPIINNSRPDNIFSTNNGIPGLILVLIKAFKVTTDHHYAAAAISGLKSLPEQPHFSNFSFSDGLAGIGELYLEAYKVFNDTVWLQKASWIAKLFALSFQSRTSTDGYWIMNGEQYAMADLSTGNAGAIHFLMHYLMPDKMHHPLAPYG